MNSSSHKFGLTASGIARLRGYVAEDHYVTTKDGYILSLARITNPLINNGKRGASDKDVILCIHGIFVDGSLFVINSEGVQPRDYSKYNISSMNDNQIQSLLAGDPAQRSLALLAANFGHEVWLLNRRGSQPSLGRVNRRGRTINRQHVDRPNSSSRGPRSPSAVVMDPINTIAELMNGLVATSSEQLNSNYWNYSFDEQAEYDFPAVVNYILKYSGRKKTAVVAHSAGGAITLMALTHQPKLADKMAQIILLAPALDLGKTLIEQLKDPIFLAFQNYVGPFPPLAAVPILQNAGATICNYQLAYRTICTFVYHMFFGDDDFLEKMSSDLMGHFYIPASGHELAHLAQSNKFQRAHKYDFNDRAMNMRAYGSPLPPLYNTSRILAKSISFWVGNQDTLVSLQDVEFTRGHLNVPTRLHILGDQATPFSHQAFFLNRQNMHLAVIPNLRTIQSGS